MEPIFTIPYAEFRVASELEKLFPRRQGFSLFVPTSRQEAGVDLILTRRTAGQRRSVAFQVKGSRPYLAGESKRKTSRLFAYDSWFKKFVVPKQAEWFLLIAFYPGQNGAKRGKPESVWKHVTLAFTKAEMRQFIRRVKCRSGKPDRFFGFSFSESARVFQSRGDKDRRFLEFSDKLLVRRRREIRKLFV